nr:hypothetical protein [Bacillus sp. FJAT-49736]
MNHPDEGMSHMHEDSHGKSEVQTALNYSNGLMTLSIKDLKGKTGRDLEVNHEKLLHLIIVDNSLQHFYHLHPKQLENGEFSIKKALPDGTYKAFIDIKPKDLAYNVEPVSFQVGHEAGTHNHASLVADKSLTKTVDHQTVSLKLNTMQASKPVTLTFELDRSQLEPYLGAVGHVVILDEDGEKYIHVHPKNEVDPVFETEFAKPGKYKIWTEFKQNGKVRTFPFVVEIK